MKSLILAVLLATATMAQAQQLTLPKIIKLHNKATGERLGTITISGSTAYYRDKNGVHYATTVRNPDGTLLSFDAHGNVINMPMPGE